MITYEEMLAIVSAIYKMTGAMVTLPEDEDTPEKVSPSLVQLTFGSETMGLFFTVSCPWSTRTDTSFSSSLTASGQGPSPSLRELVHASGD